MVVVVVGGAAGVAAARAVPEDADFVVEDAADEADFDAGDDAAAADSVVDDWDADADSDAVDEDEAAAGGDAAGASGEPGSGAVGEDVAGAESVGTMGGGPGVPPPASAVVLGRLPPARAPVATAPSAAVAMTATTIAASARRGRSRRATVPRLASAAPSGPGRGRCRQPLKSSIVTTVTTNHGDDAVRRERDSARTATTAANDRTCRIAPLSDWRGEPVPSRPVAGHHHGSPAVAVEHVARGRDPVQMHWPAATARYSSVRSPSRRAFATASSFECALSFVSTFWT
jgi:hypothetical protein